MSFYHSARVFLLIPALFLVRSQSAAQPHAGREQTGPASRTDTVYTIGEVVVIAARLPGSLFETPLAVTVLEPRDIHSGRAFGLDEALSAVPGVLAQSRSGGQDVRLTVRGFGARGAGQRSNAGTSRGIRVMIDGLPETEPDGRTSFDLIDLSLAETMEIVRSNATVLWGNAGGGVVNIRTVPRLDSPPVSLQTTTGGFGFRKLAARLWGGTGRDRLFGGASHTTTDGWREHSQSSRTVVNAGLETTLWTDTHLGVYLAAGLSSFRIPGPLTPQEFLTDPYQAQDDPSAYSPTFVQRDERRINRLARLGFTISHPLGGGQEVSVTAFATPKYLQRSERNTYRDFTRYHVGGSVSHRLTASVTPDSRFILQTGLDGALQDGAVLFYSLVNGGRGPLQTNKREGAASSGLFVHGEVQIGDRLSLLAGARLDAVKYDADEFFNADPSAKLLAETRTFSRWTPKAGVSFRVTPAHSVYVNVGGGLEVPAGNETDPPSTAGEDTLYALNPLLDASRSTTVEIGTKHALTFATSDILRSLSYDVAAYWIDVQNDFIPYRGGRFYFTAGKTERLGVEAGLTAEMAGGLTLRGAVTVSDNSYREYTVDSVHYGRPGRTVSYAGNRMAGVPGIFYHAVLRWTARATLSPFVEASLNGSGRYFADDANRFDVPPFAVWNLRAGADFTPASGRGFHLFFSGTLENVAGRTYAASAWINPDLNTRGEPVYLEPGSPRLFTLQLEGSWVF